MISARHLCLPVVMIPRLLWFRCFTNNASHTDRTAPKINGFYSSGHWQHLYKRHAMREYCCQDIEKPLIELTTTSVILQMITAAIAIISTPKDDGDSSST